MSPVDWVLAALPMVEFHADVCRVSPEAMGVIGAMDLADQARLVLYRRAVQAGFFTEHHADDRPCFCRACMHRAERIG